MIEEKVSDEMKIQFEEIEENNGLEGNDEIATLDMKLKNSSVNTTSVRIVKGKSSYYVVVKQYNDVNFFIECVGMDELTRVVEKLIVNLDYSKVFNYHEMITMRDSRDCVNVMLVNNSKEGEMDSRYYGYLVKGLDSLYVSGERFRDKEDIGPLLLDRITRKDGVVDFSLEQYSLITMIVLFDGLVDRTSFTNDDKLLINQYKRKQGLEARVSDILREDNYLFTDNLGMYVEIVRRWVDLFSRAPKLKRDIIVYRGGEGINRRNKKGFVNLYDGLVSFSLVKKYAEWFAGKFYKGESGMVYKMMLPKGTNCLSLFNIRDIEGSYVEEMEVLLPSFIYEVIGDYKSRFNRLGYLGISYVGEVPMLNLFYERIKKNLMLPIAKDEKGDIAFSSKDNIGKYEENGYDIGISSRYKQVDMKEAMLWLMEANLLDSLYESLRKIEKDELLYESELHGFRHIQRVYIIATLLAQMDGLDEEDKRVLFFAVWNHDLGRVNDREDELHGLNGVKRLENNSELMSEFSKEEQDLIKFVIAEHSMSTTKNKEAISELEGDKRERYSRILNYLKDSDKLDRVRLGKYETTDIDRLTLDSSKRLVLFSYELEEYLEEVIDYIYVLINYKRNKRMLGDVLREIEEVGGLVSSDDEMVRMAIQAINGGRILESKISLEAINEVTKNILIEEAKEYFNELLEPIKRLIGGIRRGR